MTETTGAITALRFEDHDPDGPRRGLLRSAGKPHPGVELRVVETGQRPRRRPRRGRGNCGRGRATTSPDTGTRTRRQPTRSTPAGWLRTGNAGYFDADGYLYLHDRIKDMIVSGGENIYPAEVENVLLSHEAIVDAAVIGVSDDKWGETVKAIVVLDPGVGSGRERGHLPLPEQSGPLQVPDLGRGSGCPASKPLGEDPQERELRAPYSGGTGSRHQLRAR